VTVALGRRQLFTKAVPRGLAGILRGLLQACQDLGEWAAAAAVPLSGPALSSELLASLPELDRQLRLEHPEFFTEDVPDPRDREAFQRWIEERQERRRREREERLARQPVTPDLAPGEPPA
jgi:hypothetical protein